MSQKQNVKQSSESYRVPVTVIFAIACLFSIIYLYYTPGSLLIRIVLATLALIVTGQVITRANGFQASYGIYLWRSRRGISLIEKLADSFPRLWSSIVQWGLVLSFGIFSYFVFKRQISKKVFAIGLVSLLLMTVYMLPLVSYATANLLQIPSLTTRFQALAPVNPLLYLGSLSSLSSLGYIIYGLTLLGGFFIYIFLLLFLYAGGVIFSIVQFLFTVSQGAPNTQILTQQIPGVIPVIPGITLPLLAGLVAIAITLSVHEFMHGVFARRVKLAIKSVGLVLFGIIPIGAFVEPDERKLEKAKVEDRVNIFIAGISANLVISILFFFATALMLLYVVPNITTSNIVVTGVVSNSPAFNVIKPNSTLIAFNNVTLKNITQLATLENKSGPNSNASVLTSLGFYHIKLDSSGKMGVYLAVVSAVQPTLAASIEYFFYQLFALLLVLNFLIGVFNLMPLPMFDGWQLYKTKIKDKRIINALAAIFIILFITLALPWLWTGI